jgi:hypothetical protein
VLFAVPFGVPRLRETSAPIFPFSRLGLSASFREREKEKKKNLRVLASIRAKHERATSYNIRAVLLKANLVTYLF